MADIVDRPVVAGQRLLPDLPLVVWLILGTLLLGLLAGYDAPRLIGAFNAGYGASLGEFALILVASFILAAALEQRRIAVPPGVSVAIAPFAAAGMVCPDTAYAALAPMCRRRKLSMAFGAYAGFKLLIPAGPLIVGTMFGADASTMLVLCVVVFVPVLAAGVLYGRLAENRLAAAITAVPPGPAGPPQDAYGALVPFAVLAALLVAGAGLDASAGGWLDFLTSPKGALIAAATCALAMIPRASRRPAVDKGVRRAAGLLLIIGAAGAFSRIVTEVAPIADAFAGRTGLFALLSLFLLTAAFKLIQGSSMATFAAVGPVAAPIVVAADVSPALAVIAVCLGSFVAILPNDSYYWLVRQDAMPAAPERTAIAVLLGGAVLQALVGFGVLMLIAVGSIA